MKSVTGYCLSSLCTLRLGLWVCMVHSETFQFRGASFQSGHPHPWQVVNVLESTALISLPSRCSGKFSLEYYLISSIFRLLLDFFPLHLKCKGFPWKPFTWIVTTLTSISQFSISDKLFKWNLGPLHCITHRPQPSPLPLFAYFSFVHSSWKRRTGTGCGSHTSGCLRVLRRISSSTTTGHHF